MSNFKKIMRETYELPLEINDLYIKSLISQTSKNTRERIWQFSFKDLRNRTIEVSSRILAKSTFSEDTIFPEEFYKSKNIGNLFETAKLNRFGIDLVHDKGINGSGMHVAVIDQSLIPEGKRFYDNLIFEHRSFDEDDSMHANAVVDTLYSICPMAKIHFFDQGGGDIIQNRIKFLEEIYTYNQRVPSKEKILVISLSCGFLYDGKNDNTNLKFNYLDLKKKLANQNCHIVDSESFADFFAISSPVFNHDFSKVIDIEYGEEWRKWINNKEYEKELLSTHLLVPGGGRLYAIPSDKTEFVYTGSASYSWSIPIVAGMLLLSKSIKRNLSLKNFYSLGCKYPDYNSAAQKVINLNNIIENL